MVFGAAKQRIVQDLVEWVQAPEAKLAALLKTCISQPTESEAACRQMCLCSDPCGRVTRHAPEGIEFEQGSGFEWTAHLSHQNYLEGLKSPKQG